MATVMIMIAFDVDFVVFGGIVCLFVCQGDLGRIPLRSRPERHRLPRRQAHSGRNCPRVRRHVRAE